MIPVQKKETGLSSPGAHSGEGHRACYSFGNFTLDVDRGQLTRNGEELVLRPKSFEVLVYLVEHHGRVVTKAELVGVVWRDTAVTDNSLAQCIVEIRRALNDDAQQVIRTVARRGYILNTPITIPRLELSIRPVAAPPDSHPLRATPHGKAQNPNKWHVAGVGVLCLSVLIAGGLMLSTRNLPRPPERSHIQVTNFTDSAVAPALSPDGRMVAFYRSNTWFHTPDQLYVKLLPDGDPVQLTNDSRLKYGAAFSPDSSRIAYTVVEPGKGWSTFSVSPLGGEPSLLLSNAAGLTWMNRQRVLFSEIRVGAHMGIVTSTESRSDYRQIYFPDHERKMAHFSYASPDRKWALVVEMDPVWQPCRLIPLDGSSSGRHVGPKGRCTSAAWSPDGNWMYFGVEVDGAHHLWRQRFPSGQPQQITFGPTEEDGIAMAPDGRSLITSIGMRQSAVWIHDAGGDRPLSSEGHVAPMLASLSSVSNFLAEPSARFSSDGKSLYFLMRRDSQSALSGLWRREVASGKTEAVLRGIAMEEYEISSNGKEVLFTVQPSGKPSQIWLAQTDGSSPPKMICSSGEKVPRFGAGGKVLFQFTDGKNNFIGHINKDGSDRAKAFSESIIDLYNVSPDGRWAIAGLPTRELRPTVAIPLGGGAPRQICSNYCPVVWAPDGRYLYVGLAPRSQTSPGKTAAIPIPPGESVPDLQGREVRLVDFESALPGSRVINGWDISPGPDPSVFAYIKTTVHRNLYRISLP